jgi:regulator of replication initiation timing
MKPIEQIGQIKQKVHGLLKKQVTLEKENEKLRTELDRKVRLEQELKEKVGQMEEQVNVMKVSTGQMDEKSKKAFEKQLNQYIKEIDRCIAMLSQ